MTDGQELVQEIDKRYSELAEDGCCLSCGGALNYAKPLAGETCVDIGSGRGTDALKMAVEAGKSGFAYGIDISEGMIKKARKNAAKAGITNARFIHTQLHDWTLENGIADLVISNCTINHAPDKPAVWREVYRVLKQGGRFVVSDIFASEKVPEKYANDPSAVAECWAGSVTRGEYIDTLEKAGFVDINILEESEPYPKGEIFVSSFTVMGWKKKECCCKIQ
ncbi:MAG: methyltransferase domain-containing protein [bacterium]|nr:methyltransferase domain-containing protein [bacterium]